ncbi:MAG: invasion associated locus B family protein [Rhizobiaceae bacterium]
MRILISTLMTLALVTTPALAQSAKRLSQFKDWATYSYKASNGQVCYVLSVPSSKEPSNLDHGDIYFSVSQKPGQNVAFEPQFIASYNLKEKSKVTVTIDGKPFTMFTKGKLAWLENAAEEPTLVAAMKAGSSMKVAAVSGRGNPTNYTFSLSGITAALDSIKGCK